MGDHPSTQITAASPGQDYERAPAGLVTTTPQGLITTLNDAFAALIGRPRDAVAGRIQFADLLTAGGRIYLETHVGPMLQMTGAAQEIALDLVRADGGRVPVLINSTLERDAAGRPALVRTAVFQATARRSYEHELVVAKRRAQDSERRAVALALTLQQTLIPPAPPVVPGLDIGAVYRPAGRGDEVGGDFYDVFQLGPGRWVVTVGDVSGKGIDAAVVTALARHTLRAAAVGMTRPSEALHVLNGLLVSNPTERFCTVGMLLLEEDHGTWTTTVSSGGHPLPVLARHDGTIETVGGPGSLIGAFDDVAFRDTVVRLGPGDMIVLYTDGISEARGSGDFYGEQRLHEALQRLPHPASTVVAALLAESLAFQDDNPRDDIAVVAVSLPATVGSPPEQ